MLKQIPTNLLNTLKMFLASKGVHQQLKIKLSVNTESKAGLTLNDLYDTICRLTIGFQIFICVYTIIQVVHTEFIKVVLTKH